MNSYNMLQWMPLLSYWCYRLILYINKLAIGVRKPLWQGSPIQL